MVLSVAAAAVTGFIYILPLLFTLPDIQLLLAAPLGQPIPQLLKDVMGGPKGGFGLLFLLLGIFLFSGVGALTTASRSTWAFSRDGAIPFSCIWSQVNVKYDVPVMALLLSVAVDSILGLIYLGSSAAFNAFTGVATICLSVSYGIPILISLCRGRKMVRDAPFSLGRFGYLINAVTVLWITFAVVLFTVPTAIPVTPATMNYASVVFAAFTSVSAVWYILWGRANYKGPHITDIDVSPESDDTIVGRPGESGTSTPPEKPTTSTEEKAS